MSAKEKSRCDQLESVAAYALRALPPSEMQASQKHISVCGECQQELEALRPAVDALVSWPTDVLRSPIPLWERLLTRIEAETNGTPCTPVAKWREPEWEDVAPGISCKLLSSDSSRDRVSMLVRLAPGTYYPPHNHAGVEELHLLRGELWIEDRKLYPGDYNRADPGTGDKRVWSETGCTCLLITSPSDILVSTL